MNDAKAPPRMTTLMYKQYMSWQARGTVRNEVTE